MRVLAGDIGGTKTRLMVATINDGKVTERYEKRYENKSFDSFSRVWQQFRDDAGASLTQQVIERACLGVAGPISAGHANGLNVEDGEQTVKLTNLLWPELQSHSLAVDLGLGPDQLTLINDFEALAYYVAYYAAYDLAADAHRSGANDLMQIQQGFPHRQGVKLIVGAGTGLGHATVIDSGAELTVLSSQGGHMGFAPVDELQLRLLAYLRRKKDHVAVEDILSGPGIVNIYQFLLAEKGVTTMTQGIDAADVSRQALAGDDVAQGALNLFIKAFGAHAGNVALMNLAYGGIYLAGGIAPKLAALFHTPLFLAAFGDKGQMSGLLKEMPVHIIVNESAGVLGAAWAATRSAHR